MQQKTVRSWPLSAKVRAEKIETALINTFSVMQISKNHFTGKNFEVSEGHYKTHGCRTQTIFKYRMELVIQYKILSYFVGLLKSSYCFI